METEYRVLAPNSVAWHIQAALVADRTGNEAARDLALREAQRVVEERRLAAATPCYDCRTTGERLGALEREMATGIIYALTNRLAALERAMVADRHQVNTKLVMLEQRLTGLERWRQHADDFDALMDAIRGHAGPDAGL